MNFGLWRTFWNEILAILCYNRIWFLQGSKTLIHKNHGLTLHMFMYILLKNISKLNFGLKRTFWNDLLAEKLSPVSSPYMFEFSKTFLKRSLKLYKCIVKKPWQCALNNYLSWTSAFGGPFEMSSWPYSATAEAVLSVGFWGSQSFVPGLSKRSSGLISDATSSLKTDRSSLKKIRWLLVFGLIYYLKRRVEINYDCPKKNHKSWSIVMQFEKT